MGIKTKDELLLEQEKYTKPTVSDPLRDIYGGGIKQPVSAPLRNMSTVNTEKNVIDRANGALGDYGGTVDTPAESEETRKARETWEKYQAKSEPTYKGTFDEQLDGIISKVMSGQKFDYNYNADPVWNQLRTLYEQQGDKAGRDAEAGAAALTGGYGNSYGATAGAMARADANQRAVDIIPELRAQRYSEYQAGVQDDYNKLASLRELRNDEYSDYKSEKSDYNSMSQYLKSLYDDSAAKDESARKAAEEKAQNDALLYAQFGDLSKAEALGINTSNYNPSSGTTAETEDKGINVPVSDIDNKTITNGYGVYTRSGETELVSYAAKLQAANGWDNKTTYNYVEFIKAISGNEYTKNGKVYEDAFGRSYEKSELKAILTAGGMSENEADEYIKSIK